MVNAIIEIPQGSRAKIRNRYEAYRDRAGQGLFTFIFYFSNWVEEIPLETYGDDDEDPWIILVLSGHSSRC